MFLKCCNKVHLILRLQLSILPVIASEYSFNKQYFAQSTFTVKMSI